LHDLVLVVFEEVVLGAVIQPVAAVHARECLAELLGLSPRVDELLQAGELEVLAIKAHVLVEHAGKRAQKRRLCLGALLPLTALGVDVEQNDFRRDARDTDHLALDHRVFDLSLEEVDGRYPVHHPVGEQ